MPREPEVPEGAAVLPEIPAELGAHPLLLAVLHAIVFLAGSDEALVHPDAGQEALEHMAGYLRRLAGPDLARIRLDLAALHDFARQQKWKPEEVEFFETFLTEFGVGEGEA